MPVNNAPNHPIDEMIKKLNHLNKNGKGADSEAESIRRELHEIFIIERGELEDARNTGYWYYNDQPHVEDDETSFSEYWPDVLML